MKASVVTWIVTRSVAPALLLPTGCTGVVNCGAVPGVTESEVREVDAFEAIAVGGSIEVDATLGDQTRVEVHASPNVLEALTTEVKDGMLYVKLDSGLHFNVGDVRVDVITPELRAVSVTGSGDVRAQGLKADAFSAGVSGSGDIELKGEAAVVSLKVSGSGDITAAGLQSKTATVAVSGSGDISLSATERVSGSISGSGDVSVQGGATCSITVSGSGDVRC